MGSNFTGYLKPLEQFKKAISLWNEHKFWRGKILKGSEAVESLDSDTLMSLWREQALCYRFYMCHSIRIHSNLRCTYCCLYLNEEKVRTQRAHITLHVSSRMQSSRLICPRCEPCCLQRACSLDPLNSSAMYMCRLSDPVVACHSDNLVLRK